MDQGRQLEETPARGGEADGPAGAAPARLCRRLHRALGPIVGGLVLDSVDLATFGPVGLHGGFLLGGAIGWWLGSLHGFGRPGRLATALAAAAYAAAPWTTFLPVATVVSALATFREDPDPADEGVTDPPGA